MTQQTSDFHHELSMIVEVMHKTTQEIMQVHTTFAADTKLMQCNQKLAGLVAAANQPANTINWSEYETTLIEVLDSLNAYFKQQRKHMQEIQLDNDEAIALRKFIKIMEGTQQQIVNLTN